MYAPTAVEMDAVNCGHRLATISVPSQPTVSFREAVLSVVQQLGSQDVIAIKFLLSDIIPAGRLELLKSGLHIVSELENALCLIGPPGNVQFLAELVYHVGRHDLLKKLHYTKANIESLLNSVQKPHVCPYRLMLHSLCQELRRSDVETLKFLCSDISPASLDSIRDAHDLFRALESRRLLSPNSLDYVVSKLSQIPRMDLVNRIKRFQTAYQSSAVCSKSSLTTELVVFSQSVTSSCADSCLSAAGVAENGVSRQSSSTVSQPSQILQLHVRDNAYPMRSNPRGICLIINNKTFHQKHGDEMSKKMPDRKGTDVDRDNLQKIFEELKFRVEIENDLTAEEMVQKFRRVAEYDHRQYDCFVCCVLSHGECGTVYGVNGRVVSIRDLTSNFKAVSCPSLVGKPKLFFIQACQGSSRQIGFADATADLETDNDGTADPNNMVTIPEEADFLLGLATVPGFVSYRSREFGSWYITSLVRNLREFGDTKEILHILTHVNAEVSMAHTREGLNKQVPMPMYTLRKELYLK